MVKLLCVMRERERAKWLLFLPHLITLLMNTHLMVIFLLLVTDSSVEECQITCTVYSNGNVKVTDGKVIGLDVIFERPSVIRFLSNKVSFLNVVNRSIHAL